jgi:hypothetical protein
MERRQRDSLVGLFEGDEEEGEGGDLDFGAIGQGLEKVCTYTHIHIERERERFEW